MSIERNLPENKQARLDKQVFHWEEVTRKVGSALEMLKLSQIEMCGSPQACDQFVMDKFSDLAVHLDWQLIRAKRMADAAISIADANTAEQQST